MNLTVVNYYKQLLQGKLLFLIINAYNANYREQNIVKTQIMENAEGHIT